MIESTIEILENIENYFYLILVIMAVIIFWKVIIENIKEILFSAIIISFLWPIIIEYPYKILAIIFAIFILNYFINNIITHVKIGEIKNIKHKIKKKFEIKIRCPEKNDKRFINLEDYIKK